MLVGVKVLVVILVLPISTWSGTGGCPILALVLIVMRHEISDGLVLSILVGHWVPDDGSMTKIQGEVFNDQ